MCVSRLEHNKIIATPAHKYIIYIYIHIYVLVRYARGNILAQCVYTHLYKYIIIIIILVRTEEETYHNI